MSRRRDDESEQVASNVASSETSASRRSGDSVVFGDSTAKGRGSDGVDPITQAIKEEILKKQQAILRNWYAENAEKEEDKQKIRNYSDSEFKSYTIDNPEIRQKAYKDKELLAKLHKAEVEGYRNINQKFHGQFRNLDWDNDSSPDSRSKEIKNSSGQVIANLMEKTISTPISLRNVDGELVKVDSYRAVDFPKKLDGEGPMHLQMAAKDAQGNNIAEDKAVYFTAHYNKAGNLESLSHPVPIKFMGKGKDAIGYIECEGKIYTLPVTLGKYNEMSLAVKQNRQQEANVEVSRSTARDQVSITGPDVQAIRTLTTPTLEPSPKTTVVPAIGVTKLTITSSVDAPDPTHSFKKGVISDVQRLARPEQTRSATASKDDRPSDPKTKAVEMRNRLTRSNSLPDLSKTAKQPEKEVGKEPTHPQRRHSTGAITFGKPSGSSMAK